MSSKYFFKVAKKLIIIFIWLVIWQLLANVIGVSFIFPSVTDVLKALLELIGTKDYYRIILSSGLRISIGFLMAFVVGIITATLAGRFKIIKDFLEPVMQLLKTIPVTTFIILVLIWAGSQNVSIVISFIITLPMIYSGLLSGIAQVDIKLIQTKPGDVNRCLFHLFLHFELLAQIAGAQTAPLSFTVPLGSLVHPYPLTFPVVFRQQSHAP